MPGTVTAIRVALLVASKKFNLRYLTKMLFFLRSARRTCAKRRCNESQAGASNTQPQPLGWSLAACDSATSSYTRANNCVIFQRYSLSFQQHAHALTDEATLQGKKVRKSMAMYTHVFGFRTPYRVLCDGNFLQAALDMKLFVKVRGHARSIVSFCFYSSRACDPKEHVHFA